MLQKKAAWELIPKAAFFLAKKFLFFVESFPTIACQTNQTNAQQQHLGRLGNGPMGDNTQSKWACDRHSTCKY
jgi:hypothetical protein